MTPLLEKEGKVMIINILTFAFSKRGPSVKNLPGGQV
jgi:hypothetical protein